jgi:ribosomal protein S18 acetylase RimI-like enzyme
MVRQDETVSPVGITVRDAVAGDEAALLDIVEPVVRAGQTYAIEPDLPRSGIRRWWIGAEHRVRVAEAGGRLVGTYYLMANQRGPGGHVANCGYMTAADQQGRGVARSMCLDSLDLARALGFRAMQFNLVVTTNTRAVQLWRSLGFDTVGRIPEAFQHPTAGLVDALVMHRSLL